MEGFSASSKKASVIRTKQRHCPDSEKQSQAELGTFSRCPIAKDLQRIGIKPHQKAKDDGRDRALERYRKILKNINSTLLRSPTLRKTVLASEILHPLMIRDFPMLQETFTTVQALNDC